MIPNISSVIGNGIIIIAIIGSEISSNQYW